MDKANGDYWVIKLRGWRGRPSDVIPYVDQLQKLATGDQIEIAHASLSGILRLRYDGLLYVPEGLNLPATEAVVEELRRVNHAMFTFESQHISIKSDPESRRQLKKFLDDILEIPDINGEYHDHRFLDSFREMYRDGISGFFEGSIDSVLHAARKLENNPSYVALRNKNLEFSLVDYPAEGPQAEVVPIRDD